MPTCLPALNSNTNCHLDTHNTSLGPHLKAFTVHLSVFNLCVIIKTSIIFNLLHTCSFTDVSPNAVLLAIIISLSVFAVMITGVIYGSYVK